jgi:protease-4
MTQETAPRRRSNPIVTFLAVAGALSLTTVILFVAVLVWGMAQFSRSFPGQALPLQSMRTDHVALITLNGPIGPETTDSLNDKIDQALEAQHAKAIFLEVNSPGGAVVASQEIYDHIKEARKRKPVLAYYRDVAASGSYYASAPATWIVANRSSMVGSIGVIMTQLGAKELLNWARINPIVIKTGSLKDAGSPLRDMNEADEQYLSELLNKTHQIFIDDLMNGRNTDARASDLEAARKALGLSAVAEGAQPTPTLRSPDAAAMDRMRDGRVVLGQEALDLGLVDYVGSSEQAMDLLRNWLGNPELKAVEIVDPEDLGTLLDRYLERVQVWAERMVAQQSMSQPRVYAR